MIRQFENRDPDAVMQIRLSANLDTHAFIPASLQRFIPDRFYPGTPEILAGPGEMYMADEHFRQNIGKTGGCCI